MLRQYPGQNQGWLFLGGGQRKDEWHPHGTQVDEAEASAGCEDQREGDISVFSMTPQSYKIIGICSVFPVQAKKMPISPGKAVEKHFPYTSVPCLCAFGQRKHTAVLTCGDIFPTSAQKCHPSCSAGTQFPPSLPDGNIFLFCAATFRASISEGFMTH